jgi:IS5 family transposase
LIARGGQITDATLVPAPRQHLNKEEKGLVDQGAIPTAIPAHWRPAQRRQKDTEATWTKKHGKSDFGFKLSVNVDKKYKVIRKIEKGTASIHATQHFDAVFDETNTSRDAYADRGYPSDGRTEKLKTGGFCNHIQCKGKRNNPLSQCQQLRNRRIAKTRARLEHVLARSTRWAAS